MNSKYLNPQVFHEFNLIVDDFYGQPVCRELAHVQASRELLLLEHGDVLVAEAGEERGAGDGSRAAAQQPDLGIVGRGQISAAGRWRQDLGDLHVLEHLNGKVLEAADVDGALLRGLQVAAAHAQIGGGTDLETSK